VGQACFNPGMMKSTYGTGCFALLNTGSESGRVEEQAADDDRLSVERQAHLCARRVDLHRGRGGAVAARRPRYREARIRNRRARGGCRRNQEVYLVPAFVGLGAPHWNSEVRGAMFGLTRNSGPKEFARAALESVCFQTADLLEAMQADWPQATGAATVLAGRRWHGRVRLDHATARGSACGAGGPADVKETTAMGAAYLAGLLGRPAAAAGAVRR
jgi:glycerol kinase